MLLSAAVFIGSQLCGPCHSGIFDAYLRTPMAQSSGRVESIPPATFTAAGHHYRIANNKLLFDGGTAAMDYFIGSNAAGRTYIRERDGYLFELPVTWYAQKRAWDASPGYEHDSAVRLTRAVESSCLQALPRFQRARELAPRDPRAALYLGLTTESVGRPADALVLYQEAVRLERATGQPQAETLLPGARLLMLLGRLEECESWIRQAVKLSPNLRDAHFELARLLLRRGEPAQAAAVGEHSLRLSEGTVADTAIHYLLIRAWQQSGMPDRAAAHAAVMRAQENPAMRTPGK